MRSSRAILHSEIFLLKCAMKEIVTDDVDVSTCTASKIELHCI